MDKNTKTNLLPEEATQQHDLEQEAIYQELEKDVRLLAINEEDVPRAHRRMRQPPPPRTTPPTTTAAPSLQKQLQQDLYKPESLQKAFLLSEILQPKHGYK